MDLYGQGAEAGLFATFIARLEYKSVLDRGAERGAFAEVMLHIGADHVHLMDDIPANAEFLRERFRDESRVTVHEPAPSQKLSLTSLVNGGHVPKRLGVLKLANQGNENSLVAEMGEVECDIVIAERPSGLTDSGTERVIRALRLWGFTHFAFLVRQGEVAGIQWDDRSAPTECAGMFVFVHARALGRIVPLILHCAAQLAESQGDDERWAPDGRYTESLRDLRRAVDLYALAADERLEAIEELLVSMKAVTRERDLQARAAAERLAIIEELERDRDLQLKAAQERLLVIEELSREHRTGS